MCWLNSRPDCPGACLVCNSIATLTSKNVGVPDHEEDRAFDTAFNSLVSLPDIHWYVGRELLSEEAGFAPPQVIETITTDDTATHDGIIRNEDFSDYFSDDDFDASDTETHTDNATEQVPAHRAHRKRHVKDMHYDSDTDDSDDDGISVASEQTTSSEKLNPKTRYPKLRRIITNITSYYSEEEQDTSEDELDDTIDGIPCTDSSVPLGIRRLLRFLGVLELMVTPRKKAKFFANEDILIQLIATHLRLIVGNEEFALHKTALYNILGSNNKNIARIQNVIWITNRQQGKTTTLSRFLAALSYLSPVGGRLAYVYSLSRDRSQELVDGAKEYLWLAATDPVFIAKLAAYGLEPPEFIADNSFGYAVRSGTNSLVVNVVKAKPQSMKSCRGDAPETVIIDEVGFVEEFFWKLFAFPLTQVFDRLFIMVTTPAPYGSFFHEFTKTVIERNEKGDFFMSLTNHSLVCDDCQGSDNAMDCSHRLYLIPPWKSLFRLEDMSEYVSLKDRKEYMKEVFGVISGEGGTFFKGFLVDRAFGYKNIRKPKNLPAKVNVYIGIDPPQGEMSCMGLAAITYSTSGKIYYLGLGEISMMDTETTEMEMLAGHFTISVLKLLEDLGRPADVVSVIPIVETNNCGILSAGIVKTIERYTEINGARYVMPFTRQYFGEAITDGIGVRTDKKTKPGYIQHMISLLVDNRIAVADRCVTIGSVYKPKYTTPSLQDILYLMCTQLYNWRNTNKGPSGKAANNEDDMSLTGMMVPYWSNSLKLSVAVQTRGHSKIDAHIRKHTKTKEKERAMKPKKPEKYKTQLPRHMERHASEIDLIYS